jgi:hypothetical protein
MGEAEDQAIAAAFAAVPERNTGDVLLRTTQQHHVQLSVMADTKANILITVSSIILTLILGKMTDPHLRAAMATLAGFIFTALLLAVISVLPKYRPLRIAPGAPLPPNFNLLFFGTSPNCRRSASCSPWRGTEGGRFGVRGDGARRVRDGLLPGALQVPLPAPVLPVLPGRLRVRRPGRGVYLLG